MSETTNENLQEVEEAQVVEITSVSIENVETPIIEESISTEPKLIGTKVITIKTDIYDNDQQNISINTPDGSSMAENLGMLDICRHILLKDKF